MGYENISSTYNIFTWIEDPKPLQYSKIHFHFVI